MRVTGDGGVGIEVWVDGPEDGTPVLFMHGWPDTHDLWRHQVAALTAAGYRTIAPDLRGFGETGKPDLGPTVEGGAKSGHSAAVDHGPPTLLLG